MKNVLLQMLSEFIASNYDSLKKDYNSLSEQEKAAHPSAIFFIGVFDRILSDQHEKNQKQNESKIITENSTIIPTQNKIITV